MVKASVTSPKRRKSGMKDVAKSRAESNSTSRQRSRADTSQTPSVKRRDLLRESLAPTKPVSNSTPRKRAYEEDDPEYLPSSANKRGKRRGPASHRKDYEEQEQDEEVSERGSDEGESEEVEKDVDEEVDGEVDEDVDEEVDGEDDEDNVEGEIEVDIDTAASGEPFAKECPKRSLAPPSKLPTVPGLTAKEVDFLMIDVPNMEHSFLATCGEFLVVDVVEGCI